MIVIILLWMDFIHFNDITKKEQWKIVFKIIFFMKVKNFILPQSLSVFFQIYNIIEPSHERGRNWNQNICFEQQWVIEKFKTLFYNPSTH